MQNKQISLGHIKLSFGKLEGSLTDAEITEIVYDSELDAFVANIRAVLSSAKKSGGNWQNRVIVTLSNTKQKASAETAMSACSLPRFTDKVPGVTSELMKELRDELAKSIKAGDYSAESKKGDIKLSVNILPDEVKLLLEAKRLKHK